MTQEHKGWRENLNETVKMLVKEYPPHLKYEFPVIEIPAKDLTTAVIPVIERAVEEAREEGRKEMMRLANEKSETPNRAVRYVALDKLFDAFAALSNKTEPKE